MVRFKKKLALLPVLAWLMCLIVSAAGTGKVYWSDIQGTKAVIYIQNDGEIASVSAQAGTAKCPSVSQTPMNTLPVPVETLILVDNSLSIPTASRQNIAEFLDDLVGARIPGERFTITCVSDKVNYLCQEVSDYATLKQAISSIQYQNQETYITDVLYEILSTLRDKKDGIFRRLVIVSDGVDNKEVGYTREELYQLMDETKYPIYAIGCRNNTPQNGQELENFFAIARRTAGAAYELQNSMNMVGAVTVSNQARRVEAELPPEVCDGTQKGVQVSIQTADGNTTNYTIQLTMPMVEKPAEQPAPVPQPVQETPPPVEEPVKKTNVLPIVIGVLAALAAVVAIVLVVLHKKKKERIVVLPAGQTQDAVTEVMEQTQLDSQTEGIFNNAVGMRTIVLADLYDNARRFELPLGNEPITIGRSHANKVCLDYEPTVSRSQCVITQQNGRVMLSNKSGTSMTVLDGQPLTTDLELRSGSVVKMGRLQMKVEIR